MEWRGFPREMVEHRRTGDICPGCYLFHGSSIKALLNEQFDCRRVYFVATLLPMPDASVGGWLMAGLAGKGTRG